MKKIAALFILVCSLLIACDKNHEDETQACFKGRYLGEGCWPIIQILDPRDSRIKNSQWGVGDSIHNNVVGVGFVPEKYKDGKPFYIAIDSIVLDPVHTTHCSTSGHFAIVKSYSDSACITSAP